MILPNSLPYVGKSAFAHKGGMHVDGVMKNPRSFEHIDPELVGNRRNVLLSEVSGKAALLSKLEWLDSSLSKDSPEAESLVEIVKEMEYTGYQFEAATASLELLALKHLGRYKPFFELTDFKVIGERNEEGTENRDFAMIKIRVGDRYEITADEGDGPVHGWISPCAKRSESSTRVLPVFDSSTTRFVLSNRKMQRQRRFAFSSRLPTVRIPGRPFRFRPTSSTPV